MAWHCLISLKANEGMYTVELGEVVVGIGTSRRAFVQEAEKFRWCAMIQSNIISSKQFTQFVSFVGGSRHCDEVQ